MANEATSNQDCAVQLANYIGAFLDELQRGGLQDVVISPGSRSTPLAMMALASNLNVYLDVDERGAGFFALGTAKATGRAVALICTSGTAVANYYPAVLEAETSRVPLLVLSGDRPARLQQLGAPQTCDQLKIFGNHVRQFWNMPELNGKPSQAKFARQVAREAVGALAAHTLEGAPVHINFPFDEPLVPVYKTPGVFEACRSEAHAALPPVVQGFHALDKQTVKQLATLFSEKRVIALCGEGTLGPFNAEDEGSYATRNARAEALLAWAHAFDIPLLADPLSQLRNYADEAVIENYDNFFGQDECPNFDVVVRFGRYPVSKRVFKALETTEHIQLVVDTLATRDFNAATTTLIKTDPVSFVASLNTVGVEASSCNSVAEYAEVVGEGECNNHQNPCTSQGNIAQWAALNAQKRELINSVEAASFVQVCTREGCYAKEVAYEGAYVQALLDCIPDNALLFSANSMAIRALDTFYTKPEAGQGVIQLGVASAQETKQLTVLANRGLNGIDGTLSSALGAAQAFKQTYFLTGDLTLMHDINAFALQHEFSVRKACGKQVPAITVVLFNNAGGGIFDMLPQKSEEPYFERLFLTPQAVNFEAAAQAFGVAYKKATSLESFRKTLNAWNGEAGIHLVEVEFSLDGLEGRFRMFQ
jgi:2-succinyl-5-enolpyruvyl-6-hydroxy-3-cyclohexene-1-carboxylate synthase